MRRRPWLWETYREDRLLVADLSQFGVTPYREGSVACALVHIEEWNREESDEPLQFCEFKWLDRGGTTPSWRRAYGLPTDGTHRAAAANEAGVLLGSR